MAILVAGCVPAAGTPTDSPSATPSASPTRTGPAPSRSATRSPAPTPSLPSTFEVSTPLIDGGAATVVAELHRVSGLRPALKLDVTADQVTLIVLGTDKQARGYRWLDGVIESAETDVQYLGQTIFWPTDFALENVRLMFNNAALLGTSSQGQLLQVVDYRPGHVFMSVSTTPETDTIFFTKDGSVVPSLDTTAVADIRQGINDVTGGSSSVYAVGFSQALGYYAEVPKGDFTERRSRMANRPTFYSQRAGNSALEPFDPSDVDAASLAQSIVTYDSGEGCAVEIDNRFERVQPVVTYECSGETFHSDLQGRDMTDQLR